MNNLIGFTNEFNNLLNLYNSKNLHNAIIIYGPKGIGKRIFVNNLIINFFENIFFDKNLTHHINLFKNNSHPNIKILEKELDRKTKKIKSNISIDQIRNLKKFVVETSTIKNLNKFVIVDSADDLNINSSNSFLKTLEEPKDDTFLFLISHQLSSLLPTVRSRCLKIKLNNPDHEQYKNIIKKQLIDINDDEIQFFYEITHGSPGITFSLYDNNIIQLYDQTLNCLVNKNINFENIDLSNTISKFDNDKFKNYLAILKSILVLLNKIKFNNINRNNDISTKFNRLFEISSSISLKFIIEKLDFLSKNEKDLFTFNLDKKLFMLNFLNN